MKTCLRALAAGLSPVMSELLHVLVPSLDRRQRLKATPPPAIMPNVLTTSSSPVRQKRTGTSHMVSYTRHNNEQTLSRNDSLLGCLHLALAHRYYFCVEEIWEHVFVHCKQSSYQSWANCFVCWNLVSIAGLRVATPPPAIMPNVLTTRPSLVRQ